MKRISCYIAGLVAACCAWGLHGCTEESPALAGHETATLRLNIPQLEVSSRSTGTDAENAIHSLWVLVWTNNGEGEDKVVHNTKYVAGTLPADHVITIENVPVGPVEIYVVANEESIGKTYEDLQSWEDDIVSAEIDGKQVQKVVFKDESRQHFPLKGEPDFAGSQEGLPMSWEGTVEVAIQSDGAPQNVTVELKRMVAKINLTISHDYTDAIEINEIAFGKFFGDRLYLFQPGDQLAIPSDVVYADKVYGGLHVSLPENTNTRTLSLYVYPSFAWEEGTPSNYTLGFTTTVGGVTKVYPAKALVKGDGSVLTQLLRNHVLDVSVKLSDTNVEFDYNVRGWTDETVKVPDFE